MADNRRVVAERLLRVATGSPIVVDFLLREGTGISEYHLDISPTPAAALSIAKDGGAKKACTVAASLVDAEALDALARKDSRLGVRRLVAANSHTATATLEFLLDWAARVGDEASSKLASRVSPEFLIATAIKYAKPQDWRFALKNFITADQCRLALTSGFLPLVNLLAPRIAAGSIPGFTLDDAFACAPVESHAGMLTSCWVDGADFDAALATKMRSFVEAGNDDTRSAFRGRGGIATLDDDARRVLAASDNADLRRAAVELDGAPKDVRATIIARGPDAARNLLCSRPLDLDEVEALIDVADSSDVVIQDTGYSRYQRLPVENRCDILTHVELPTPLRLRLLRGLRVPTTAKWLLGQFPLNHPRPGEVAALVVEPGFAFTGPSDGDAAVVDPDGILAAVNAIDLEKLMPLGWGPELFESLSGAIGTWAAHHLAHWSSEGLVTKYLFDRLTVAFGADVVLWETAITLMPGWSGKLSDLVNTALVSCGHELTAEEAALAEPTDGQQAMF